MAGVSFSTWAGDLVAGFEAVSVGEQEFDSTDDFGLFRARWQMDRQATE